MDVEFRLQGDSFVWDEKKACANEEKHGISFQEACEVLYDPFYQMHDASRKQEQRYLVLGYSESGRLLAVVVDDATEEAWRIISARKATPQERARYEKRD
ncbi:MAG: BrnT family toxin [Desulfarculaceae bacterium]|nr:BrnT family toxin [Desulfarculaceae bacterium]MCF8071451.1 BrnT family toxin [Desulfarculaceae bacterium]MCF8103421.1 BrnT family toxin [Desulfarculaceae bacterium]MCF8117838.1 BrnT family toxin [Desulfarculaceae bacterium]